MKSWRKMARWRKAALGTATVVAILILAAAVALKILIDPERLKKVARDKVKQAWSRELRVGDMKFEIWPLPAVLVRELKLVHPTEPPIVAGTVVAELELLPLLIGQTRYRNLYFKDATVEWEGAPWRIEEAVIESDPDLKNVRINASLWRNRKHVALTAQFDDLSRLGKPGARSTGRIDLDWGHAQLAASGIFPIDGTLRNHSLAVDVKAESPREILEFIGSERKPRAAFNAQFETREGEGLIKFDKIVANLGRLRVKGDVQYKPGPRPVTNVRLNADYLDWARTYLDVGGEPVIPPAPPEMFTDTPLAWWMLTGLQGMTGTIEANVGTLVMRNGVLLTKLKMQMAYVDDKLDMPSFTTEMLGGSATGSIQLLGKKKSARFNFDGSNLLMERWFKERGSPVPFTGGTMKVTANFASSGNSFRQLAGSISGPFTIRMGRGVLNSARAGEAEAKMTSAFAGSGARQIDFECAGFALPFKGGRASGDRLIGAQTTVSSLMTSGFVDMRTQEIDLRGRLKGRSGVGMSTIAGDVKITGTLRQPHMSLDETATPKAIARGAAAIATLGLSVIGTARADSEDARRNNPCEGVFRR